MIVVSDTTPLNHLILIEAVGVLPALFGRVYAPNAVMGELADPHSPPEHLPAEAFTLDPRKSRIGRGDRPAWSDNGDYVQFHVHKTA